MTQHEIDQLRRDVKYAALPGKINAGFVIALLCIVGGMFAFFTLIWVYGFLVRTFFGGF
jgi:hypothetical protein